MRRWSGCVTTGHIFWSFLKKKKTTAVFPRHAPHPGLCGSGRRTRQCRSVSGCTQWWNAWLPLDGWRGWRQPLFYLCFHVTASGVVMAQRPAAVLPGGGTSSRETVQPLTCENGDTINDQNRGLWRPGTPTLMKHPPPHTYIYKYTVYCKYVIFIIYCFYSQ